MLRTLRWNLVDLQPQQPYCLARLRRITDQLTYILESWADQPWPTTTAQGGTVPPRAELLGQLQQMPEHTAAQQRQLLTIVLLLL